MSFIDGTFTAPGASATLVVMGDFDINIAGTWAGSINLERSYDGGVTFFVTDTFTVPISAVAEAPSFGVRHRLNATALSSGTATFKFGQ